MSLSSTVQIQQLSFPFCCKYWTTIWRCFFSQVFLTPPWLVLHKTSINASLKRSARFLFVVSRSFHSVCWHSFRMWHCMLRMLKQIRRITNVKWVCLLFLMATVEVLFQNILALTLERLIQRLQKGISKKNSNHAIDLVGIACWISKRQKCQQLYFLTGKNILSGRLLYIILLVSFVFLTMNFSIARHSTEKRCFQRATRWINSTHLFICSY